MSVRYWYYDYCVLGSALPKAVDVLTAAVGRQILVPSSWFGTEYGRLNPGMEFYLDIRKVLPSTRGYRRRLLIMFEHEAFYCDRKDYPKVVKPYLVDRQPTVDPSIETEFIRAATFDQPATRVILRTERQ